MSAGSGLSGQSGPSTRSGRRSGGLSEGLGASFVAAGCMWLTMGTWSPLTEAAARFVVPLLLTAVLVAATGSLLRAVGASPVLVLPVQMVLVAGLVLLVVTGSAVPDRETLEAMAAALRDSADSANRFRAPVPAQAPPVAPLFLSVGAAALLLMDLVAVALGRVAASGLLLLAVYAVPVAIVGTSAWWQFALIAGGFLLLLFLQQDRAVSRWGRGVPEPADAEPETFGVRTGAVRSSALAIGGATTAVAVLLPALAPSLGLELWSGPGNGSGDGDIVIDNPLVDLRRDLQRGEDMPLLRVTTTGEQPTYVRLSVLKRFNGEEWSSGDRTVPSTQLAQGAMPPLVGVSPSLNRSETLYTFQALEELESQWLPTMPMITDIQAPGDWRFDRTTMDFISGDEDQSTAGLSWRLHGVELEYDAELLDNATSGATQVGTEMVQVPANLPGVVRSLTEAVAGSEPTRFRQARALQDWFRTEFTYSLEQVDHVGNSEIAAFLDASGREGYCEQFAAAMAVMARILDIPARVAVGFLEPELVGPSMWEFSAHDLHAWPELFFPGSGWVRFEPTPASRASGVPGYTTADLPEVEETTRPNVPRASEDLPDRAPTANAQDAAAGDDEGQSAVPWAWVGGALGVLALALLVAAGPRWLRARRRSARLSLATIEAVWEELRDHARDLGYRWPNGRSPHEVGQQVRQWFGAVDPEQPTTSLRPRTGPEVNPEATLALDRLVRALEQTRYGRPGTAPQRDEEWLADLDSCAAALTAGVGTRTQRRATWWPVSVVGRRSTRRPTPRVAPSHAGTVDHLTP